ncbi:LIM and SH3 domain protein 1 isoform X1 [Cygnus olor]|uniref:LIM and SH3 domain protein 1 isoform X1 n=1 Tax=Cygnus olor TaxID=8869 RepID=UPI001ADE94EF|nr:LIM and SH3 domain protein 1 isoform X1 [Cygnus olor]
MNPNCARCGKIVYPTEKVNCLDKFWHKACFHCETCKMTLNMKNYKGYEKKPYCNAHYPKQSFTMVADTPENLRLKQQSELQSQIRYKEEFEKNKGKGFSVVADTPELQRIKKTQDQISNIKYHEEFERSRMGPSPSEGAEMERRNSQESTNYRRPAEQQQQPSHHVQPSNPGRAQGSRKGWQLCSAPALSAARALYSLAGGFVCPLNPSAQPQLWLTAPILPSQSTSSSSRCRLSPTATRSPRHQPLHSATLLLEAGSVSALSTTTTQPTKTRSPSRTATPSSTCSRSMTGGCTARWSARATRACSPPTTWRPSEPREGTGRAAPPPSPPPAPAPVCVCASPSLPPSTPSPACSAAACRSRGLTSRFLCVSAAASGFSCQFSFVLALSGLRDCLQGMLGAQETKQPSLSFSLSLPPL